MRRKLKVRPTSLDPVSELIRLFSRVASYLVRIPLAITKQGNRMMRMLRVERRRLQCLTIPSISIAATANRKQWRKWGRRASWPCDCRMLRTKKPYPEVVRIESNPLPLAGEN